MRNTESLNCRVDSQTLQEVRHILRDPVKNKTEYGSMGALVTRLLRDWLEERRK